MVTWGILSTADGLNAVAPAILAGPRPSAAVAVRLLKAEEYLSPSARTPASC